MVGIHPTACLFSSMMLAPAWPDERDGCDPFRQRSLLTSSTASIASQRTVELAVPRYDIRKQFYSPRTTLPPLTYGGEGRLNEGRLSDPTHVGDLIMARSVEPGMVDRPVVLTSPRLSPRYRVPAGWAGIGQPAFVPPSSSRLTGIISPRTARLAALEEIPGKKVYDAVARGDMEHLSVLVKDKATDLNFSGVIRAARKEPWVTGLSNEMCALPSQALRTILVRAANLQRVTA